MRLIGTSTQRTYRYVRIAIVGAVVLLVVSLIGVVVSTGTVTSLSALYYTPGRGAFVGALFAVGFGLIALSGHSVEQALLDLAALFAPVIAVVPTPIVTGDVPGMAVSCATPQPCVPGSEVASVMNGVLALAAVGVLGVITALVLALAQGTFSRGVRVSLAAAGAVVVGLPSWALIAPASFLGFGHLVATSAFFGLIAVISAVSALGSARPWRVLYGAVALGIAAVLVLLVIVLSLRLAGVDLVAATGAPLVLIGELTVVLLFATYWIAQTAQKWSDPDPSFRT